MAEDSIDSFRYGLSDLPTEPPDNFNSLYSAGQPAPIGMTTLGAPQIVQAGFRLPLPRRFPPPPGAYPNQSQMIPPIRIPEVPDWWKIPDWWKAVGIGALTLPSIVTGTFGANGRYDDPECQKQWGEALDLCAKELAKPYPNRYVTGGHTTIEDCARGWVDERCGGNPSDGGGHKQPSKKPPKKPLRR